MQTRKKRFTPLDAAILAVLLGVGLYIAYRIRVSLNYKWDWSVIPQYLAYLDEGGSWRPGLLAKGLIVTLRLSIVSAVLATIFGLGMGLFRVSPRPFRRMVAGTYVGLVRNLPPLVLVVVFYYFLGDQIISLLRLDDLIAALSPGTKAILSWLLGPPNQIPAFVSAALTLALFEGAYIAEIVRAGIESVEKGQWEAAAATGMTRYKQLRHVVLPQALRRMLPALAGQFISTIKDSAIVSVISIQELTFAGQELMAATYRTFEIWITVLVMYFALTFLLSLGVRRLETVLSRRS